MQGDLLAIPVDAAEAPTFRNSFWGQDHKGFEVLYSSLKSAPSATKEIADFVREVAIQYDQLAKNLARLGKQEKTNTQHILLSPIWKILKSTTEKSGAAHNELSAKLTEISREMRKYAEDDCRERYKPYKKQLVATGQSTSKMQQTTQHLNRSRESRTRVESSSTTGTKHDKQLKRTADDMKKHVDMYNQALDIFEPAIITATEAVESLEKEHVHNVGEYLKKIHKAYDSCIAISQINNGAFRETMATQSTPEFVLQKFAERRGTGMERPEKKFFEPPLIEEQNPPPSPGKQADDSTSFNRSASSANSTSSEPVQRQESLPSVKPKIPNFLRATQANRSDLGNQVMKSTDNSESDSGQSKSPPKPVRNESTSSGEIDDEGYTVRRQKGRSRKTSTSSDSSGWDFEEDGKVDTYKIKVQIKSIEETEKESNDVKLVKLEGPMMAAPIRKAPRPGRSPRTVQTSPLTIPTLPLSQIVESPKVQTEVPHPEQSNLNLSVSEKSRESPTKSPPSEQKSPIHFKNRPLTPVKTGGSLVNENINWTNPQGSPYDAPIASAESMSPVLTPTSPSNTPDEIHVRAAITETINAKFLAVGDENTQVMTNADVYLDFPAGALKILSRAHNLTIKLDGGATQVKVNPAFGRGQGDTITLDFDSLINFLRKMAINRPSQSHHMMKIATYRVISTPSTLPLLLASYWKKEKDDYKVKVVAKPTSDITAVKLLLKTTFEECESDPQHVSENGFLSFCLENLKAGTDQSITAYLSKCSNPTAFAAQFATSSPTETDVVTPESSSLKIKDTRKRVKIGFYISEPIL